jgi:hypothetical protein
MRLRVCSAIVLAWACTGFSYASDLELPHATIDTEPGRPAIRDGADGVKISAASTEPAGVVLGPDPAEDVMAVAHVVRTLRAGRFVFGKP